MGGDRLWWVERGIYFHGRFFGFFKFSLLYKKLFVKNNFLLYLVSLTIFVYEG